MISRKSESTRGGLTFKQYDTLRKALKNYHADGKISIGEYGEVMTALSGVLTKSEKKKLILKFVRENYIYGDYAVISNDFFIPYGIKSRSLQNYIKELKEEGKIEVVYDRLGKLGGMKRYISIKED